MDLEFVSANSIRFFRAAEKIIKYFGEHFRGLESREFYSQERVICDHHMDEDLYVDEMRRLNREEFFYNTFQKNVPNAAFVFYTGAYVSSWLFGGEDSINYNLAAGVLFSARMFTTMNMLDKIDRHKTARREFSVLNDSKLDSSDDSSDSKYYSESLEERIKDGDIVELEDRPGAYYDPKKGEIIYPNKDNTKDDKDDYPLGFGF